MDLVDNTYNRMLVLREEETKKLERNLKKEDDPIIVLQCFQITPLLNRE